VGSVGTVAAAVDVVTPDSGVVADAPVAVVDVAAAVEAVSVVGSLQDFFLFNSDESLYSRDEKCGRSLYNSTGQSGTVFKYSYFNKNKLKQMFYIVLKV
jgi:hypothetical protein